MGAVGEVNQEKEPGHSVTESFTLLDATAKETLTCPFRQRSLPLPSYGGIIAPIPLLDFIPDANLLRNTGTRSWEGCTKRRDDMARPHPGITAQELEGAGFEVRYNI